MRKKPYTREQIEQLEANPHTFHVTRNRLQLTLGAKEKILKMVEDGYTARNIVCELGYDPELLGQSSVDGIVYSVKLQARSAYGIHEGYKKRQGKHLEPEDLEMLPVNAETVGKLINEVVYLRQKVEFLKKLSAQENTKKRGESQ
ncbi:MAG: hypothetical protein Q4C10_03835 [Clostridia bacterium]|nr:hypothetical protein [Clostridia bacterium]